MSAKRCQAPPLCHSPVGRKLWHNYSVAEKTYLQSYPNQDKAIIGSLHILDKTFNKQSLHYRVIGSLLVAALNGKPHRKLGDIDILIDESEFDSITSNLRLEGYAIKKKTSSGFNWIEANHQKNLGFTFLLVGKFNQNNFTCNLTKTITLEISNAFLYPTPYTFFGIRFTGIPLRSIYEGLKISSLNPKKASDRSLVAEFIGGHIPAGESLNQAFRVLVFGIEIPYAYTFFSYLYNIYGGLRVLIKKQYEIWDWWIEVSKFLLCFFCFCLTVIS